MSEELLAELSKGCGDSSSDKDKPVSSPTDHNASLEGLLSTLKTQIKNSNWLEVNTPQRWEQENPALAAEYKKAVEENSTPSSTS